MALAAQFPGDVLVQGNVQYTGSLLPGVGRSSLITDTQQSYMLPWTFWRQYAAFATNLAATSSGSDLALVGGTFGTGVPSIQTSDLKNAGATTRYARCTFQLPPEYVAGAAVTVRLHAGMVTTVASASATAAVSVYKSNKETLVSGSDLNTTSATSINSLTFANVDYTITATGLAPGDDIDIRIALAVNDSGTGTPVIACVGRAELLLNIKG